MEKNSTFLDMNPQSKNVNVIQICLQEKKIPTVFFLMLGNQSKFHVEE